jgi:tetratricopeptide (TPR) repeat protein
MAAGMRRSACTAAWSLLLATTVVASHVSAASLDTAVGDARTLTPRLSTLRSQFVVPAEFKQDFDIVSKIADGQLRFRIGDWNASALLLSQIVDEPRYAASAGIGDARFMLAESLYQLRNFGLAKIYFQQLVTSRDPQYALPAARRLLEVAFKDRDFAGLDAMYNQFSRDQVGSLGPEIAYIRGKSLYAQGDYQGALASFQQIPITTDLGARSTYFAATSMVRLGRLDDAQAQYEALIGLLQSRELPPDLISVLNLARLARARVFYEQKKYGQALDAYAEVDPASPQYKASLYETAWCFERENRLREAIITLRRLQIFAISDRKLRYYSPEAALLIGDFNLREERYNEASTSFQLVLRQYRSDVRGLDEIVATHESPESFYAYLVNPSDQALAIPPFVESFFTQDAQLQDAQALSRDISAARVDVRDAENALYELDTGVNTRSRVNIFPQLRDGWARGVELEMQSLNLLIDALDEEGAKVVPTLDRESERQYQSIKARRMALEASVRGQPRSFAQITERQEERMRRIRGISLELFAAQREASEALDGLRQLRDITGDNQRNGRITRQSAQTMFNSIEEMQREFQTRLDQSYVVQREVAAQSVAVGIADDLGAAERELRTRFREVLAEEAAFLRARRGGVSAADTFAKADTIRQEVAGFQTQLDDYFAAIDRNVSEKVATVRGAIEQERARVESLKGRLSGLEAEVTRITGAVAQRSFIAARDRLNDLLLRANRGILDVSWRQKENLSEAIDELYRQRDSARDILDKDFAEILKDQ